MTEAEYRDAQLRFLAAGLFPNESPAMAYGLAWLAHRYAHPGSFANHAPLPSAWGLSETTAQHIRDQVDSFLQEDTQP